MDAFTSAIAFVLPHEEEFARGHWGDEAFVVPENVAGDNGGVTKYGIDQASHPHVDVANLTKEQAVEIYHQEWLLHRCDLLPPKLAVADFDVWVNGGQASVWLQEAYNTTHPNATPLKVDGVLGPTSLAALASAYQSVILDAFLAERDARFRTLAAKYPNDRQFLSGWLQRDLDLRKFLAS